MKILSKMPILAILACATLSFSNPGQTLAAAPNAVTAAQAPASETDVLKAYSAASSQAEGHLKAEEDRELSTLRFARAVADMDYSSSTAADKLHQDKAEESFNEGYRKVYWQAEDVTNAALKQAAAVRDSITGKAREAELAANKQAAAVFSASVKKANETFETLNQGGDPERDAIQPARQNLKLELEQFGKDYAGALAASRSTRETAESAAANAYAAAESQAWKVRALAHRPVEEMRDYMEAEFKTVFDKDTQPALSAKQAAEASAVEAFRKIMTPYYKARDEARLKRLDIWQRYKSGAISADDAVTKLTQIVHH